MNRSLSGAQERRAAWDAPGAAYHEIAETLRPAVDCLLRQVSPGPESLVLDAACGSGLASLIAARAGASVVCLDFAPSLIAEARRRAESLGLASRTTFTLGDVEQLPFRAASFDVVISNFGLIFATDHDAVAREAARVLRPDGVLAFTAWKPEGPNLRLMTVTSSGPPPPEQCYGVFDWGCEDHIREILSPAFHSIAIRHDNVPWLCPSPSRAIDMLLYRSLGPTITAFHAADVATKRRIHRDCIDLFASCLTPDGSVRLDRHYVAVHATRRSSPDGRQRPHTCSNIRR